MSRRRSTYRFERVLGEQYIIEKGGVLLCSAGIYGPGRDPRNWLRSGRIKNSNRLVNLIHIDDLTQFVWHSLNYGEAGKIYIAADGAPQRWADLAQAWQIQTIDDGNATKTKLSKRVDATATMNAFNIVLKHKDALAGTNFC